MLAARYYGPGDLRVESVTPDECGPSDVRIEVEVAGICGTDVHEYRAGPFSVPDDEPHPLTGETLPVTLGHEVCGTVIERGAEATLGVGQRVVVNPIHSCRQCRHCDAGDYHLCDTQGAIGKSGNNGGFAESLVVPAEQVVPVPDGLSSEEAALVEPFAVALHAVRRSTVLLGDEVVVFGAGPIGLGIVQALDAAGATRIIVSEPNDRRRALAQTCGASRVLDPRDEDPDDVVADATNGGADVCFEVAGVEPTLTGAIDATAKGGEVVVVSVFEKPVEVHPTPIVTGERTLTGSIGYATGPRSSIEFSMTMDFMASGQFDAGSLVTRHIDLRNIVFAGFESLASPDTGEVKILVHP